MKFNSHRRNFSLFSTRKQKISHQSRSMNKMIYNSIPNKFVLSEVKDNDKLSFNNCKSIEYFENYLNDHPYNNQALYLCSITYLKLNKPHHAIAKLNRINMNYQKKKNSYLLTAIAYNKIGQIKKAISILNQCLDIYQKFQQGYCYRGKMYIKLGYLYKAQIDFKTGLKYSGNSHICYLGLADCLKIQLKYQQAILIYQKIIQTLQNKNQQQNHTYIDASFKYGVCLYNLQRFKQSMQQFQNLRLKWDIKLSENYYYLALCQLKLQDKSKALLNLQYCIRMQSNKKIAKKAQKILIQINVQLYQYYQAQKIIQIGKICGVKQNQWQNTIEGCMLVIKGQYEQAIVKLNIINEKIKAKSELNKGLKMQIKNRKSDNEDQIDRQSQKIDRNKSKYKFKINSNSNSMKFAKSNTSQTYYGLPQCKQKCQLIAQQSQNNLQDSDKQFLIPRILIFKAYAEFFQSQYMSCLDSYEEYLTYMKLVYGEDVQDQVLYNKTLCQGLLMSQNDMFIQGIDKYTQAIELYYNKNGNIPPQPLLYKIVHLVKMVFCSECKKQTVLSSIVELINNYLSVITQYSLVHYFKSIVQLQLGCISQSIYTLQKIIKINEECSWQLLYVKAIAQLHAKRYYNAAKQCTNGLIIQSRSELYLLRAISFLLQSTQQCKLQGIQNNQNNYTLSLKYKDNKNNQNQLQIKQIKTNFNNVFAQNCFEDLQSFIQSQQNQQYITQWVCKLLFYNQAYDEVSKSLNKLKNQNFQINLMKQCLSIYDGQFLYGGQVGQIIIRSFQGILINENQQELLLKNDFICDYKNMGFLFTKYEKWLIILHLYAKLNYNLLIKYLQRQLFMTSDQSEQIQLKYNMYITYLLLEQINKAIKIAQQLREFSIMKNKAQQMVNFMYSEDQCLSDLADIMNPNVGHRLSEFLSYRPVTLKLQARQFKVYVKLSIPFPQFPKPNIFINLTDQFIQEEINASKIPKKIDAPWIKKKSGEKIQFTDTITDNDISMTTEEHSLAAKSQSLKSQDK